MSFLRDFKPFLRSPGQATGTRILHLDEGLRLDCGSFGSFRAGQSTARHHPGATIRPDRRSAGPASAHDPVSVRPAQAQHAVPAGYRATLARLHEVRLRHAKGSDRAVPALAYECALKRAARLPWRLLQCQPTRETRRPRRSPAHH